MADSNIKGQGLYTQKGSSWKTTQPSPAPNQKPRKIRSTLPSNNPNKQIFAYPEGLETLLKGWGEKKNLY